MKKVLAPVAAILVISGAGIGLIKEHEGLRTRSYLDVAGIPTECYGHTGPEVKLGTTKTVEQCEAILLRDISTHQKGVKRCINTPLTQNEQDAVVSFTFNVGVQRFCSSTMAKKLNAGDKLGAANEFRKWNKATVNGQLRALPGLTKRREAERRLFLTPDQYRAPTGSPGALRDLNQEYNVR